MPEITALQLALVVVAILVGVAIGWGVRGSRTAGEKAAINAGWQEQLEAQRVEHGRLVEQNRGLMDQNSQYQASNSDAKRRASELSAALKEAFERRDELQRQIKEIRGNLETAVSKRDELQDRAKRSDEVAAALRDRDRTIGRLRRELENWQQRLPPLIDRYKTRNDEAARLEDELAAARDRIASLEASLVAGETRVEPVDRDTLGDHLTASNETIVELSGVAGSGPGANRDDLKRIKGIGPAIEKTLNEMGFFRFHQIAEMSEYDIDRVAQRLKGFRSRIYREDWTGQARELQLGNAGG
jgi:predicted flap endonuclease-1-like 5' DNA nuclease